jgi:protein involved in polysaccharide export with SLBB domain
MPDQRSGSRATTATRALVLAAWLGLALTPGVRAAEPYNLGPGDIVQITVYAGGEKQVDFTGSVSALIGEFKVAGLTTYEVERTMREVLARDYYVDPQVMVSVKEYGGQIFVMGAVKKPGAYGLQERMTVLGACLLAEGFTDFASPRRVKVTRMENGKQKTIKIDLIKVREGKKEDLPLQRGDRIEVPRRRF